MSEGAPRVSNDIWGPPIVLTGPIQWAVKCAIPKSGVSLGTAEADPFSEGCGWAPWRPRGEALPWIGVPGQR